MHDHRMYSPAEYQRIEGTLLPPARLAQIWRSLPEHERRMRKAVAQNKGTR